MRKTHSAAFKAKVVLEALRETKTMAELASEYQINPNLITRWKKQLISEMTGIFSGKRGTVSQTSEALESELYRQIGQLKVELDWLKKKYEHIR